MSRQFRDYGIRPKGSPEISYDPLILMQMLASGPDKKIDRRRQERVAKVYHFIMKVALEILPPKQREIFYSVWGRSGGKLSKGVMDLSRRIGKSHFTSYNSYYKAVNSLRKHLDKTGYTEQIIAYLKDNDSADDDLFE